VLLLYVAPRSHATTGGFAFAPEGTQPPLKSARGVEPKKKKNLDEEDVLATLERHTNDTKKYVYDGFSPYNIRNLILGFKF
jgi:hypothetical protein